MKGLIIFFVVVVFAKAKPSIYENHHLNGLIGYGPLRHAQLYTAPISYASYYASPPITVASTTVDLSGPVHTGAILSGPKSAGAIFRGPQDTGAVVTGPQSTGAIFTGPANPGGILSDAFSHAYVPAVHEIAIAPSAHVALANPAVPVSASLLHVVPAGVITKGGGSIGVSAAGAIVKGPPTVPVVIEGPSGKIEADGLWGPTLEGLPHTHKYY